MITLDQRGCGQGKTTTGIYNRIVANESANIKTLIVVPSINLMEQYKKHLPDAQIINSSLYNKKHFDLGLCQFKSTVEAFLDTVRNSNKTVIVITHSTFLMLPKIGERKNYDLIIDEAIEDIIHLTKVVTIKNDVWKPNLDLLNIFEFKDNIHREMIELQADDDNDWYELIQFREATDNLFTDSPSFKAITDKNFIPHVTGLGWSLLNGQTGGELSIVSTLNPDVLRNWKSVYIACAAFQYTKMYHWMRFYDFEMYTPSSYRFKPHDCNIKLFTSNNNKFKWSNSKRETYPEILKKFHEEVIAHTKDERILALRNNGESQHLGDLERKVNHNVHGLNDLQEYTNVSLESALIPDPRIKKFILDNWLQSMTRTQQNKALIHMQAGHLFYQVIMRTRLRSLEYANEQIKVFVPDQDTGVCITDYFNPEGIDPYEMDITSGIKFKPRGQPEKEVKLTPAEKQKRYREKKKET